MDLSVGASAGNEGTVKTTAPCDICGAPMTKRENGCGFECKCGQAWIHDETGWHCTILKNLWPSKLDENSAMFRDKFVPAWVAKHKHYAALNVGLGLWDNQRAEIHLREVDRTFNKWHLEHPLPWWRRWLLGRKS